MSESSTGKLLPVEPEKRKELLSAFATLSHHAAFQVFKARIAERLRDIDIANRMRGNENQCTEAQALAAILAIAELAEEQGEVKIINISSK